MDRRQEVNLALIKTLVLALRKFDNPTLAALNLSVQGFGEVLRQSIAYEQALNASLIREDGKPYEHKALCDACAFEVNRRIEAGIFN